jgi:uncharacterized coiled-coil protein SlyX
MFRVPDNCAVLLEKNKLSYRVFATGGQTGCDLIDNLTNAVVLTRLVADSGSQAELAALIKCCDDIEKIDRPQTNGERIAKFAAEQTQEVESLRKQVEELQGKLADAKPNKPK